MFDKVLDMHWMYKNSENSFFIEFQLDLSVFFPNNDLNANIVSFKNRSDNGSIKEGSDYQTLLVENKVYNNIYGDKSDKSDVNNDCSNVKQTNLLKYNFIIDKKFKCGIMGNNESEIEQISDFTDIGVNILFLNLIKYLNY